LTYTIFFVQRMLPYSSQPSFRWLNHH